MIADDEGIFLIKVIAPARKAHKIARVKREFFKSLTLAKPVKKRKFFWKPKPSYLTP